MSDQEFYSLLLRHRISISCGEGERGWLWAAHCPTGKVFTGLTPKDAISLLIKEQETQSV